MNKYVLLSIIVIALILAIFTSDVLTQKSDPKITIFNESIQLETSGDYQKAINKLLGIYKDNQNDYLVNLRLGWLYYNIGKFNESKDYYNKAITITNRKSVEALLGLTLPLSAMNEWNAVKSTYKEIIKLDYHNYTANLRLGQIFLNLGDYISAKQYNHFQSQY
jgi:tetratricopeptide (TPR) repeat protein